MVRSTRETVTVQEGGIVRLQSQDLPAGTRVDVIVISNTSQLTDASLASLKGAAKGVYASAEEAERFIRSERDQWDR